MSVTVSDDLSLVLNNRDLNMVTWEQRVMAGAPKPTASEELPDFPSARYAESLGLRGLRMDRPDQIARLWDEALSLDRPVVIEACVDPNVPPCRPTSASSRRRTPRSRCPSRAWWTS